ncbi:MAG TPA: dienelactone hydrolase family protein [Herpetosiphonaceae bacterium]
MSEHNSLQAGKNESGYLALPAGAATGAVLVLHAWWGLNEVFTDLCDRLAQAGFVAYAPDLNDGKIAATIAEAEALNEARDQERTGAAAFGGLAALRAHPAAGDGPVGLIGFSMGASWAVELASAKPEDVAAVVLFYGAGLTDFAPSRAAYLGHFSETDEWEPMEWVNKMETGMREAGREVTIHLYPDAKHWFFEPNRPEYDPAFAELAWERTLAFLRAKLGGQPA